MGAAIKTWIGYSEDVSTKELPEPGASQRESKVEAAAEPAKEEEKKEEEAKPEEAAAPAAEEAKAEEPADEAKEEEAKEETKEEEKEEPKEEEAPKEEEKKEEGEKEEEEAEGDEKMQLYECMYDCDAQEDNKLSFKEGDIVTVLDKFRGAGWWKAELNGRVGLLPNNFVSEYKK